MKQVAHYQISYDPIPTEGLKTLSLEDREEYDRLYEKALRSPKETLAQVHSFREKHPHLPEIENLLAVVYLYLKQIDQVEKLIIESYHKFPDYLFARINYADQCLRKKNIQHIPQIFNNTFDLALLYPSRTFFHVSEFRGFMVFMSLYHLALKQTSEAKTHYELALEADPKHPSVLALQKKIQYTPLLKKLLHFFKRK